MTRRTQRQFGLESLLVDRLGSLTSPQLRALLADDMKPMLRLARAPNAALRLFEKLQSPIQAGSIEGQEEASPTPRPRDDSLRVQKGATLLVTNLFDLLEFPFTCAQIGGECIPLTTSRAFETNISNTAAQRLSAQHRLFLSAHRQLVTRELKRAESYIGCSQVKTPQNYHRSVHAQR